MEWHTISNKPLLLFNPATTEFSFLKLECYYGALFGFYYTSETQKYHVVSFLYQANSRKVDITILTLGKSTSLRSVKDVILPGRIDQLTQITSGTSLFGLGESYGKYDYENDIVICYDMIEVRFCKMNVPPSPPSSARSLRVLKDSPIIFVYPKLEPTFFDIWMQIDDVSKGKSWMPYRKIGPLETGVIMKPRDVCWHGRRILCYNYPINRREYISENLFYYNLETDQVEDYEETHVPMRTLVKYVESLVLISDLVPYIDTYGN